jgi:hypothetical protein
VRGEIRQLHSWASACPRRGAVASPFSVVRTRATLARCPVARTAETPLRPGSDRVLSSVRTKPSRTESAGSARRLG